MPTNLEEAKSRPEALNLLTIFAALNETDTENVIAIIKGTDKPDEYLILTAHLDHVGYGRTGSRAGRNVNKIHNGADDNASGVALMIDLAKKLMKENTISEGMIPKIETCLFFKNTCLIRLQCWKNQTSVRTNRVFHIA